MFDLVADGTVTVLSGEAGSGKSWLCQALCTGVALGLPVAGLGCVRGQSLYIDAEMGPQMFVDQRLRPAGVSVPLFQYIDAMGLDIATSDLDWIKAKIEDTGANFVVIDSLRRLSPSKSENDSDDMAPVVGTIAKLAADTGAAILLTHHKGDSAKFYRGSTAIKDQADALFGLLRDNDEEEFDDNLVRRLRCRGGKGKMRYAPEPEDVFLMVSPEDGGVVACGPPVSAADTRKAPTREAVKAEILAALPAKTKSEVASVLDRRNDDRTFRDAWVELERARMIAQEGGRWVVVVVSDPRGPDDHHHSSKEEQERAERLFDKWGRDDDE